MSRLPHRIVRVALLIALVALSSTLGAAREWSDVSGNFKVKGEVISYDGKVVRLALEQGIAVNIPTEKLSAADQDYLKKTFPNGKMDEKGTKGGDAKKGSAKLEVVGLAVVKPVANQSGDDGGLFSPGTHVRLLVSDPERNIVSLDPEKSKVASFTDNKNTSLVEGEGGGGQPLAFEALPDGKSGLVTVHASQVPSAKAVRLMLKGELHLVCGLGEDAETVRLPLNLELTLGL